MKRARRALGGLEEDIHDHIERETQDNLDTSPWPAASRDRGRRIRSSQWWPADIVALHA